MANETLFTNKAGQYAKGRPGYAPQALDFIVQNLAAPGAKVADIGSGTGIFSQALLSRGFEVYGVEPNPAMRANAEEKFAAAPLFHSVAAPAEQTTLPDHSMDLITAASAFHWFDTDRFLEECRRILVPGGSVYILLNEREYDDFTKRQHALCEIHCPGFLSLAHGLAKTTGKLDGFFTQGYETLRFSFPLTYTKENFIARSLSSSYAPEPSSPAYALYTQALQKLLDETFAEDPITIANSTILFWGKV